MSPPDVSIVIPTLNEGDNVIDTVDALRRSCAELGSGVEVIVVDDGSTDHSLAVLRAWHAQGHLRLVEVGRSGPARCRNRGAQLARGTLLVFMDAHCYAPPGWLEPLLEVVHREPAIAVVGPVIGHTGDFRLKGFGGTWHDASLDMSWLPEVGIVTEVPFAPAGCQLVRRAVFESVGGYDPALRRWGSEDMELCLRIWLFGHRICVQPESTIYHVFRERPPYDVDYEQIMLNKLRMALAHFDGKRLERIINHQLRYPPAAQLLERVRADPATQAWRGLLRRKRQRSADWFCDRFELAV